MDDRNDERLGEQPDEQHLRRKISSGPGRLWAGLFILLVGGVLLLDQMGFPLPDWLFHWDVLLIAIGLFLGLRHNFRGGAWLIILMIGGGFLLQDFYPKTELKRFIAPCILIFIGFIIMFRPRNRWRNHAWKEEWREHMHQKWREHQWHKYHGRWTPPGSVPGGPRNFGGPASGPGQNPTPEPQPDPAPGPEPTPGSQSGGAFVNSSGSSSGPGPNAGGPGGPNGYSTHNRYSSEDYIDTTSIFGGVHKKVVSKNFKGGDIVTILGGSEIDLSQAEIVGTARLDVTQVMGGTKIIVPAHWEVRSEVSAIFAGFEDKRQQPTTINPEKVLIIDGTSILGGIELKNY